ncbi:ArsC/Spx/MgsR family protein [Lactococcus garvieae]|uniref:ArsC/Spx/MgsR family protein n=1 Tax=Lactococcus garvieae TaxID=1363 RepID=UPI001F60FB28|nr:ArsC/Spx/MgsR family protein [Lactococcus garvieae]MCI3861476.1 hypothetical protein [Lactococcus garvieae]
MITLYYASINSSDIYAIKWLERHGMEVNKKIMRQLSKKDLLKVLSLTENGFSDILKRPSKTNRKTQKAIDKVENMSFKEGINFILGNSDILRSPIIIEKDKLVIGYNVEEMRVFLSKDYRSVERLGQI